MALFRNACIKPLMSISDGYKPPHLWAHPKWLEISRGYKTPPGSLLPFTSPFKTPLTLFITEILPVCLNYRYHCIYWNSLLNNCFTCFFFRKRKDCDQEMDNWLFQEKQALANSKVSNLYFCLIFVENWRDFYREILSFFPSFNICVQHRNRTIFSL